MAKPRPKGRRAKRIGAVRSWGGAFGDTGRGVGYHNLGRGIRRNAYGERFYVYDAGYVLPVPPAPLSPAAAFPLFADWIEAECEKAKEYLRERTGNKRLLPRIMAGAITIERGRIFQPWCPKERSSDYGMLAADLLLTLQGYKSLEQADDPDSRAAKSGVLGWFIRARTQPIERIRKPVKRYKHAKPPADAGDPFGKIEPGEFHGKAATPERDTTRARKKPSRRRKAGKRVATKRSTRASEKSKRSARKSK